MKETMINILRRLIGYPPFKYEIREEVIVSIWNYKTSKKEKVHAKVATRKSKVKLVLVEMEGGFEHYVSMRVNVYGLAFRKEHDGVSSGDKYQIEPHIEPYEQGKTKLGSLR